MSVLLVFTTLPDAESARRVASELVASRLAACVNIGQPVASLYHWRGSVETADEVPLAIKTTAARYPELQARLLALHPYELPEIVAIPVALGHPAYLGWVAAETRAMSDTRV
jgi:periplasmic divalent cation tolerance protein